MKSWKLKLIIITILIVFTSCGKKVTDNSGPDKVLKDEYIVYGSDILTDYGMFFGLDNKMYYFDAKSKTASIICTDPTCKHKVNTGNYGEESSECSAWINGGFKAAYYDDKLWYIALSEKEKNSIGVDRALWCADYDGNNRKEILSFRADDITSLKYTDGKIVVATAELWDYENSEQYEQEKAGIIVIDTNTQEVKQTEQLEAPANEYYEIEIIRLVGNDVYFRWINGLYIINLNDCKIKPIEGMSEVLGVDSSTTSSKGIVYQKYENESRENYYFYDFASKETEKLDVSSFERIGAFDSLLLNDAFVLAGEKDGKTGYYKYSFENKSWTLIAEIEEDIDINHVYFYGCVGDSLYFTEIGNSMNYISIDDFLSGKLENKVEIYVNKNGEIALP